VLPAISFLFLIPFLYSSFTSISRIADKGQSILENGGTQKIIPNLYPDTYFRLQDFIMPLLVTIEEHLGAIDSWPAYILEYLFTDDPSPVR
jgi:hypothetical protein